ncbi:MULTISPECIES: DinB family protein [unclassified Sphingobacterium]|uniref:DinB family protein n=1 Tax=unclassified Sphingobacterium TaxID=2609468 RepID=UPI0025F12903|nr:MULTISPECIES: DinB family protein [unclassified Sphingobacterium]
MESLFNAWKTSRMAYFKFFEHYSLEELNRIPVGFGNNLIWNIGHIIATQHKLIYIGSNVKGHIPEEIFLKYQSGTKPTVPVSQQEADLLKSLLVEQIEPTILDFNNNLFLHYNSRTTGTGFHVASIYDAFEWNNFHEGLHMGYMMSIKKFT